MDFEPEQIESDELSNSRNNDSNRDPNRIRNYSMFRLNIIYNFCVITRKCNETKADFSDLKVRNQIDQLKLLCGKPVSISHNDFFANIFNIWQKPGSGEEPEG